MIVRSLRATLVCATALTACAGMAEPGPASVAAPAAKDAAAPSLEDQFRNPPQSARPRVWWHWMNGNITQDGIAKDLAWMKRAGIGGVQTFDANQSTPQIVDKRLVYMTPEWRQAFRFAVEQADKLGLEMAIAAAPGWSETGGPWVKPEDGMKKLVWSEVLISGGKALSLKLPVPPSVTGSFQDLPAEGKVPSAYGDVALVAYRVPTAVPAVARFKSNDGTALDAAALSDAAVTTRAEIAAGTRDKPAFVTVDYASPQTMRSISLLVQGAALSPVLEASEDGTAWRKIADLPTGSLPTTMNFASVTTRHFRVIFAPASPAPVRQRSAAPVGLAPGAAYGVGGGMPPQASAPRPLRIAELHLSGEPKVIQYAAKAGFTVADDYYAVDGKADLPDLAGVAPGDVVDLTARMKADGTLDWTPPKGAWRVLRFGWSLIGKTNHPATEEATGLEVDKLDAGAVRRYLDTYLGMYRDTTGADLVGARGIQALLNDSTEVGAFNWTSDMIGEFKRLRGYDPVPWLPALSGTLIGSREQSDAFLYDFRKTIADLHSSAHYGTIARFARDNGLKTYGEALENGRPSLGDDMEMRSHADYPMGAMWFIPRGTRVPGWFTADVKGASSVAHVYGQNIAAAESLTSTSFPWGTAPSDLRQIMDFEFLNGINRPVIHTSVHQPVDDKIPGLSLGMFGQYFNRHETWAEMARPWIDYISRTSLMLQQGVNVADVGYYYGEDAPLTALYAFAPVANAPVRHAYDFVNPDAVMNRFSVDGGDVIAPGGARYRVLYLGGSSRKMTLPLLRRLSELVEQGATIIGNAPEGSPSLKDDKGEYAALQSRLWSGQPVTRLGKGRVIAGNDVEAGLASIGVATDFTYTKTAEDSEVLFVHRKLADGDVYFVANRKFRAENTEARFRVTGKAPEIWRADTASFEPVSYRIEGGQTIVPLDMGPEESVFVVFRKPAAGASATIDRAPLAPVGEIAGPWTVSFQPGRGAPAQARFDKLVSLSDQTDPGIKYFSGVATYTNSFALPKGAGRSARLVLDLGSIGDVAEVRINGKLAGTAWHAPYRMDISQAVKPGRNTIEVRVANLWVNRLIGDAQPGATKITLTGVPTYTAEAPLRKSGLIGPVNLFKSGR